MCCLFLFLGSLHFANVKAEDYRDGKRYACVAQNLIVRELMQGAYARVYPQGRTYEQQNLCFYEFIAQVISFKLVAFY